VTSRCTTFCGLVHPDASQWNLVYKATPVQKNLFEAIKAACIAASGQEVEAVTEDEVTQDVKEDVDAKALAVGTGATPLPHSSAVLAGFVFVAVYFLWRTWARWSTSTGAAFVPSEASDLQHLGRRMDDLEIEIKVIQSTLAEMMELLKAQQQDNPINN
jgi:hypothetical protein